MIRVAIIEFVGVTTLVLLGELDIKRWMKVN